MPRVNNIRHDQLGCRWRLWLVDVFFLSLAYVILPGNSLGCVFLSTQGITRLSNLPEYCVDASLNRVGLPVAGQGKFVTTNSFRGKPDLPISTTDTRQAQVSVV